MPPDKCGVGYTNDNIKGKKDGSYEEFYLEDNYYTKWVDKNTKHI